MGTKHLPGERKNLNRCKHCKKSHHSLKDFTAVTSVECEKCQGQSNRLDGDLTSATETVSAPVYLPKYKVRLMVVPIRVYDTRKYVDTYAFIDPGSEMSFCTKRLTKRLGLTGTEVTEKIIGITGSQCHLGNMVPISVKGLIETNVISIPDAFILNQLPKVAESIPSDLDVSRYSHLKGLEFPKVSSKHIDVLVGASVL